MAKTANKQHKRHPKYKRSTLLFWVVCAVALVQVGIVVYVSQLKEEVGDTHVHRLPREKARGLVQPGRRPPAPTVIPDSVIHAALAEETEVYGTSKGVLVLPAETKVAVLRESSFQRERWAHVQFSLETENLNGWVYSSAVLWPKDSERNTTRELSSDTVKQLAEATFSRGLKRKSSSVIGLHRSEVVQEMSSHFESFHESPSNVGEVRLMGRHVSDDSVLILECTGEGVHQLLLSLAGSKTHAADPLCTYLSRYCPEASQALISLLTKGKEGRITCGEIGELDVSRASEFTWILLSPPSVQ